MTTPKTKTWIRYRFRANLADPRPIKFPPPGPYWVTGEGDGYATIVAYLPESRDLLDFWPEAKNISDEERSEIEFTDRFPRPSWWKK